MERVRSTRRVDLLLDSGAFSAWVREDELSLDSYIDYLKKNGRDATHYVALDTIPGQIKTVPTMAEIDRSARTSYANLQIMKREGLQPIPVFHQGEDFYWLQRLIEDGEDYIGISPRDYSAPKVQQAWFDQVFTMLTDAHGNPLVRTHGLGVTKINFLLRYPFTTVDSTRWTLDAGYGHVLIPHWHDGRFDYLKSPIIIATTGVDSKVNARKQVRGFGTATQQHIEEYINSLGMTVEQLKEDRLGRIRTYLHYYLQFARQLQPFRFRGFDSGLFRNNPDKLKMDPIKPTPLKIYFATFCRGVDVRLVDSMGIKTRLLSYYELRNQHDFALYDYVRAGYLPAKRDTPKRGKGRRNEKDRSPWQGEAG